MVGSAPRETVSEGGDHRLDIRITNLGTSTNAAGMSGPA
jgi:hypothetical protein